MDYAVFLWLFLSTHFWYQLIPKMCILCYNRPCSAWNEYKKNGFKSYFSAEVFKKAGLWLLLKRRLVPKQTFENIRWNEIYPDDIKHKIKFSFLRHVHDDMRDVNKLLRLFNKKSKHRPSISTSNESVGTLSSSFLDMRKQPCTVKMNYGDKNHSHIKFLKYYMTQENKDGVSEKPELFGNMTAEEYKKKATGRHFKWMLSPEMPMDKESLMTFTGLFMQRMEQQTGHAYDWQAAVHTDTGHNHVHIVVNGKDKSGNSFLFPPDFIKSFARENACEILTAMNGERTREQMEVARNRRVVANRWTEYDDAIAQCLHRDNSNAYEGFFPDGATDATRKRLEHLASLGLAEFRSNRYYLKKEWKESLAALGRYNMYLDAQKYTDVSSHFRLYTSEMGAIHGIVRHVYRMDDEGVWTNALVVENTKAKAAYYVPLAKQVVDRAFCGNEVEIFCRYNQKGKLVVAMKRIQENGKTSSHPNKEKNFGIN
ncbi:MAG: relaxase/mobilization nuclease domain-containing protein [Treponema sp.]|nr:relaxase/mobilization nuclease domain-containing protein [Treponema sp.]